MAKLVIGNTKQNAVPAIVVDTAPKYYIEKTMDANGKAINGSYLMDLSEFTDVGANVFASAYAGTSVSGEIDMSGLVTLSGNGACNQMFFACTGVTGANLSSLTTISGASACSSMFNACSHLINADLSSLTTISGSSACVSMFGGCNLATLDLRSLTTVSGSSACASMLANCQLLSSANFDSLTTVSGTYAFQSIFSGCRALTELRFPSLKTVVNDIVFQNMLFGTTGCTVHFPSNFATTVTASTLGGTNTTVLYDLPATE